MFTKSSVPIGFFCILIAACQSTAIQPVKIPAFPVAYRCVPFGDSHRAQRPQIIPGRLENELYDTLSISDAERATGKEEGQCYHDTDNVNSGSGTLNGTGSYQREFRLHESVDISYVKFHNKDVAVDDNPFNIFMPEENALYVGWLAPGEWINYTVDVASAGYYHLNTVYTSKFGGHFLLECNGVPITDPLQLSSTYDARDPIEWRQAHHWNKVEGLGHFYLPKGKQLLTLRIVDQPVINFDYMEFVKED